MSEGWHNSVLTGDVRDRLADLPDSSVHCCMTSPPYWQLRDYGTGTVSVWGGDSECDHDWRLSGTVKRGGQNTDENPPDVGGNSHAQDTGIRGDGVESHRCRHCGAWRGQLGLEPTREQFIDNLVTVFHEVRRVLRDDGCLWLNLGDTYKNKHKQLIPHRTAIALQADGWVVRNDVTWAKPNPMPQSVKDRLNTTTEQIFLLTPQPDYWFDLDAIREELSEWSKKALEGNWKRNVDSTAPDDNDWIGRKGENYGTAINPAGKNPGDVFEVTTKPFPDAHFAVYPPELCEKPIKATGPPKVCAACGAPYEREVERDTVGNEEIRQRYPDRVEKTGAGERNDDARRVIKGSELRKLKNDPEFKGWRQPCDCATDATESGIVLDPFAGAGTTLMKAKELGRRFVGIELNPEYADMARARVGLSPEDPGHVRDDDQQGLAAYTDGGGSNE